MIVHWVSKSRRARRYRRWDEDGGTVVAVEASATLAHVAVDNIGTGSAVHTRVARALVDGQVAVVAKPTVYAGAFVPAASVAALAAVCARQGRALIDLICAVCALEVVRAIARVRLAVIAAGTPVFARESVAQVELNFALQAGVRCDVLVGCAVACCEAYAVGADAAVLAVVFTCGSCAFVDVAARLSAVARRWSFLVTREAHACRGSGRLAGVHVTLRAGSACVGLGDGARTHGGFACVADPYSAIGFRDTATLAGVALPAYGVPTDSTILAGGAGAPIVVG